MTTTQRSRIYCLCAVLALFAVVRGGEASAQSPVPSGAQVEVVADGFQFGDRAASRRGRVVS